MSLVSNVFNTSTYKPKAKKKGGLERFADTISAPFEAVSNVLGLPQTVETLAKPFVETYAGVQALRGKETSRWTKEHGLQTPETAALFDKRATDENLGALVKQKKAEGYKGAGATDILNVASLAPGLGTFAKGTKALGSASKVASGAERFLPTLGKTLKETVPAGAAWGSAYGAAGAYDQGGSLSDIGEGALIGGATGAAVGGGLGVAGASIGSLANKAAGLVNKDLRVKKIVDTNSRALRKVSDGNAQLRKLVDHSMDSGVDVVQKAAETNYLQGATDREGIIRSKQKGGGAERLEIDIGENAGTVSENLARENRRISIDAVKQEMINALDSSTISSGEAYTAALAKIEREIGGMERFMDGDRTIPVLKVHEAKMYKGKNLRKAFLDPDASQADKLITRVYKELIEKNTDSIDVKRINQELSEAYALLNFIKALDGKRVEGGKLGRYFAQTVGAMVGSHFGPIGSIVGAEVGGSLRGAQLGSVFSKSTGKTLEVSDLMKEANALGKSPRPTPEIIPESRRLAAPAIVTPSPADTSRLFTQEEARAYLGESARPKNRSMLQLGAPDVKTPVRDASGLLSQEEARAKLRSYGVTVDDIAPQSSKSLGSLNTSQSKTTTPTSIGISKSVAEKPKVDINSIDSLSSEITRRLEKFRSEAGIVAQREGAGVKIVTPDNGLDTPNTESFTKFNLNRAKGNMKSQADSAKKYAQTMLYENDPEFRSLVDMKDALLETKIVDAKTIPEVDEVFRIADKEETMILNETEQYAQANPLNETPSTPKDNQGNGLGQEKGTSAKALKAANKKQFDDAMMKDVADHYKSKSDSPLLSEAKKYKTAEEFVEAQGEPIYHGTMSDFQEFDTKSPTEKFAGKAGTYFTSNSGEALGFGKNVKTVRLAKDAKVKTVYEAKDKSTQEIGDAIFLAKREGYDAIVIKDVKILRTNKERFENAKRELPEAREKTDALVEKMLNGEITMDQYNNSSELKKLHELQNEINPTHTVVFNNDKIRTRQQLLDIYKKAHGEGTGVPKSSLVVKETPKRAEIVDTAKPDYIKDIKVKIYKIASDRDTGGYEREILDELSKNLDKMPLSNFKDYVDMIRKSEVNNYIKEELTNIIKSYSKKADDAILGAGSSGKSRIGKLRKK